MLWFLLLCWQKENNWDKTFYLLQEKYYFQGFHFAPQKALDQVKTSWNLCRLESFDWASFGFHQPHIMLRGLLLIYIWQSVIWVQFENEYTLQCVEKMAIFHMCSFVKAQVPLQVDILPIHKALFFLPFILSIALRMGIIARVELYAVFVHWHVTSHGTCSMAHRMDTNGILQ